MFYLFQFFSDMFIWAAYSIICLLCGLSLFNAVGFSLVHSSKVSLAGFASLAFAFGLAVLGGVFQILVAVNLFNASLLLLLFFLGAFFGFSQLKILIYSIYQNLVFTLSQKQIKNCGMLTILFASIIVIVTMALATLDAPGTDALAFYLSLPKLVASVGGYKPLPLYHEFAQIGLGAEMHYAAIFTFGGLFSPKMTIWTVFLCNAGLVWGIGTLLGLGRLGNWILIILLITSSAFTNLVWDGKTDLIPTGWGLAAIMSVLMFKEINKNYILCFIGTFLGCSLAGKLSFIVVMVPLVGIFFVWTFFYKFNPKIKDSGKIIIFSRQAIIITFWVALAVSPMVIKNWIIYDQPFAPIYLIGQGFGAKLLNPVMFSYEDTKWILSTYPLALIFGKYPAQHGNISYLVLAFFPLTIAAFKAKSKMSAQLLSLTVASIISISIWAILRPSILAPRYFLVPLITFMPIFAYSAEFVIERFKSKFLNFVIILSLVASLFITELKLIPVVKRAPLFVTESLVGKWGSPIWDMPATVARERDPNSLAYLAMYYSYPLVPNLTQCLLDTNDMGVVNQQTSTKALWTTLHSLGAEYLILDRLTHEKIFMADINHEQTPDWLTVDAQIYPGDRFALYHLIPHSNAPEPTQKCVQLNENSWVKEQT